MDKIKDEQDLLERYYQAELSCIWENSTSIEADSQELRDTVSEYARREGLDDKFAKDTDSRW
jgi:hypothetical protein